MVTMFLLNPAALLFIQLLFTCQVFAVVGNLTVDDSHKLASLGASVMFTCNKSTTNLTQIHWSKDRFRFTHSISRNETFSNFTSDRFRIDVNLPSTLNIFNAQHDDAGVYTCALADSSGLWTIKWNLTVSEKPEEIGADIGSLWYFVYILTSVIGLFLLGIVSVVCLCRRMRAKTPNQEQIHLESAAAENQLPQTQSGAERRTNNKRRSQYMERLNSIYAAY
uniref:uncharacterized protein isoform X1 n=1 Tax=Semicossyphus pulcher TaxID=241346 RepID=UPI0037E74017